MAITRVNKLGTANNTASGLSSLTLTVTATTTAHNRIIVVDATGGTDHTTAVTDSQGNTYTQDALITGPVGTVFGRVFSGRGDTPLASGMDTITLTWTGGTVNDAMIAAYEYSGLANFVPLDTTQSASGTSTGPNSGTITTQFANELVFGLVVWASGSGTPTTPNTQLDVVHGLNHSLETQEQIVAATGSYSASATITPSVNWAAAVVGYSDTPNSTPHVPANSTIPVITGSGVVGMQLTCSQGSWTNSPTAYAYQWKRDGTNITGATLAHYLVAAADIGHSLSCSVTVSNKYGSASSDASNTVTPSVNKTQLGLGI